MNTIGHSGKRQEANQAEVISFRRLPIAHAIALMLATGSMWGDAQAQQAFSAAWYAQKGAVQAAAVATGKLPNGMPAMPASSPGLQQQQANAQLQRSLANLNSAARAIALAQAQQSAARLAATANVPDGLGVGGLDAGSLVSSWINANGPTQSTANGKTIVDIKQTADKAILNWETFNIGKNTILQFDQQADWSVLNRINNATAPSVIQGQIKAPGTVMIVNANGIIFSGSSQVNTRNLVAAAVGMSNDQFNKGIYSEKLGNNDIPTFGNAVNAATGVAGAANAFGVVVEQGALIETHQATSATQGGGYVLMVGGQVSNAGTINTANGQTTLAAGDTFVIKKGVGTAGNQASTTRGNEVTASRNAGSSNGSVSNTGIVTASTGDITMTGHQIEQRGVLVASTSVDTRGTIHLQGNPADTSASITLGKDSVTAIVLDNSKATALNSQKDGLTGPVTDISGNIVPVTDRRDLSRIDISGGTVDFEGDSLTLATGGQVMVNATTRALMRDGAQIDVSGAVGVQLGMDSNNLKINVQGNEQRDAAINRDGKNLNNSDIWVDKRDLILVKADYDAVKNPNGYKTDRWYTAGGLLEVAGYLATGGHTIGEWMAQGGIVNFSGNSVVTQAGSNINLSGGTLDVQTGLIKQTFLKGADGKLYNASTAPGDLLYTGIYKGYETDPSRWGESAKKYYYNALIAPRERLENGYTVGRDAGTLVIGTSNAVLEGKISSDVYQGPQQTKAPQANLDGYYQSQNAAAQHAQLIVGNVSTFYDKTTGMLSRRIDAGGIKNVVFSDAYNQIADGLDLNTALPADRTNTLIFNTEQLNGFTLGSIKIAAADKIDVNADLKVNSAGSITLYSNNVNVNANLTAHSGNIQLGNVLAQIGANGVVDGIVTPGNPNGQVTLAQGAKVDASGVWNNLQLDPNNTANLPYINGGSVSIRSGQNATLNTGSSIDVSSGAALLTKGKTQDGKGGNITIEANAFGGSNGVLALNGALEGYGVAGGGTLTLQTSQIRIGDAAGATPDTLVLDGGFFNKGFSNYNLIGNQGLTVVDGTHVDVTMPVYRYAQNAIGSVTGSSIKDAMELWTPPVYQEDIAKGTLTQRKGASIKLQAGSTLSSAADMATAQAVIGKGAVINVDPGQSITVASVGQLTVDGRLNAWGGKITLAGINPGQVAEPVEAAGHTRSIWVGEQAILDVEARAVTAVDARGNRYGQVRNGGSIVIGGEINHTIGNATAANLFVVVRDGAVLDASGTQATLDIAGLGATTIASHGGSIALASNNGLYLDGKMKAEAGGAGAAGGSLSVALETPLYINSASLQVRQARELIFSQNKGASLLAQGVDADTAASILLYGNAQLSAEQVRNGGFDSLSALSNGVISFAGDVSLALGQSLNIYSGSLALANGAADTSHISLSAPYVRLAGVGNVAGGDGKIRPTVRTGISNQAAAGHLSIDAGSVLDMRDVVSIGVRGGMQGTDGLSAIVDRRAFDEVELSSQGDMRFLGSTNVGQKTELNTPGDLRLAAAQIYPGIGAIAIVRAGYLGANSNYDLNRALSIARTTDVLPGLPYSVFGNLSLVSGTVNQGGVVRAPLGLISLGFSQSGGAVTEAVNLLPGSLTSVSAAGLTLPYGGTVDGISWKYDGKDVTLLGVGGTSSTGSLQVGVNVQSRSVDIQRDAVLDLSGGGELLGAAFVSGRGGSTDARYHPLVQVNANGGFTLPTLSTNPVYAIVPGQQAAVAPAGGEAGAGDPVLGQQITIGAGVPGLPAGTYTLLPSTYALLPGAFRVELNGNSATSAFSPMAMRNGSWSTSGQFSIANTDIKDVLSRQLIVTPANVLRSYSQYNETSYANFVRSDAMRLGVPRSILEADAKTLLLSFVPGSAGVVDFNFDGIAHFNPARGGFGGTLSVAASFSEIEILGTHGSASTSPAMVSLYADDLNAVGASRLVIGGMLTVKYGQTGNYVGFDGVSSANTVIVRNGATLSAAEVFLMSSSANPTADVGIRVEQGASINTLGQGAAAYDSNDGFVYQPGKNSVLAVSNGRLQMLAPKPENSVAYPGTILVGSCAQSSCAGETTLYSEGSIAFATTRDFELNDAVRYGTRYLNLAVGGINIGTEASLASAAAANALSSGLTLNQGVMNRLLRGDTSAGAPALKTLSLTAGESLNFYGDVTLSTLDESGKSLLENLVITTPGIYGSGNAGDVARILTDTLVWNGATTMPGAVLANGAGTGNGTLDIQARRIEFGYGPNAQPDGVSLYSRLALGFANVNLNASERITANHKGSLSVYQSQDAYEAGKGYQYSGGNLNITAPLMTGEAGSVNRITAGGNIKVSAPADRAAGAIAPAIDALGAELALVGQNIVLDSTVVLPSGKLVLSATDNLTLTDAARIDMSGRKITNNDVSKYSWGGDVTLESRNGNIYQSAGSLIDLSAQHNQGGHLKAVALDAAAGLVDLQGTILGGSSGYYDAGGTLIPYKEGSIDIRAQSVGDFAMLNQRLNEGKVFGARSFQLKQGNLIVGDEIKASEVNLSLDNGSLTVVGTIDASGERAGSIRLSAKNGLTIAGTALLDTHSTTLRVDSYGKVIDAPNRTLIELNSGNGVLTLDSGARFDLRHGTNAPVGSGKGWHDGLARGTLELNAPRIGSNGQYDDADAATHGDIAINTGSSLTIAGARSIAVNGVARYADAPVGNVKDSAGNVVLDAHGKPIPDLDANGRPYQVIDQLYLKEKDKDSTKFIDAVLLNTELRDSKLAGLNNSTYRDALHLRPTVEIVTEGDLVVSGDLDLSGYRYASLNPHSQKTGVYGSGEPGSLVIRAGGNLNIYGSITDGFAPPPVTDDDDGWVLTPGRQAYGGDIIVPGNGVVLAEGTLFPIGKTLNYALPIKGITMASGTVLPVQGTLDAALQLPANTVLRAAVHDSAGNLLYAAGTLIKTSVTLPQGTRLDAGTVLPLAATMAAMTWPAGVPLPGRALSSDASPNGVVLSGSLPLKVGALIPSNTDVKLPGAALSVALSSLTGAPRANWAVAAMLPEGSQSWSLRMVSGADTQAADTRSVKPMLAGDIRLADTHYGLYETYERTIKPGTPARPGGAWYWSEEGGPLLGYEPDTPVDEDWASTCNDEPGWCVRYNYVWGEDAAILDFKPGAPVTADNESWCAEPGWCVSLGEAVPATPDVITIGALKKISPVTQHFSVVRTGTGNLDLIAAGNINTYSPYGIYTAGTSTASLGGAAYNLPRALSGDQKTVLGAGGKDYEHLVNQSASSTYAAWYPDHGGDVMLRAGGNLTGDIIGATTQIVEENARSQKSSANVGNWLWRQASGDATGISPIATSWWINFGTYINAPGGANLAHFADGEIVNTLPMLVGFTGIGTLGGGNLTVDVAGNAGMLQRRGTANANSPRSEGLVLTVGSTGRVTQSGELLLTGGGDMNVRIGGELNPGLTARAAIRPNSSASDVADYIEQDINVNGVLSNLRGAIGLQTGSVGGITMNYGAFSIKNDAKETRAYDPFNATLGTSTGGVVLMLGDASAHLSTRGDLVLSGTGDPGRVKPLASSAFNFNGTGYTGGAYGWFSLWTEHTAINLFSAGGNLTPSVQIGDIAGGYMKDDRNYTQTDGRALFPSQLSSVAANGSIYLGKSALGADAPSNSGYSMLLAPSVNGHLEFLAADSIYASGYAVTQSGASSSVMATPFRPAIIAYDTKDPAMKLVTSNLASDASRPTWSVFPLFTFGVGSVQELALGQQDPTRFYAEKGDIVGLRSGEILTFTYGQRTGQTLYEAGGPVRMLAGRDIVNSGTQLNQPTDLTSDIAGTPLFSQGSGNSTGNLFVHNNVSDVSVVSAGRDILYSSFNVAGPGTLEVTAGRNILMGDRATITSIGAIVQGDARSGASIVMQAGAGSKGIDYLRFVQPYLDVANLAQTGLPLASQGGKVAKTYEAELISWLHERYGFIGDADTARIYYLALPSEQQRVFARNVYFAELTAGGREYNDVSGARYGSFLRSRNAIAGLVPMMDENGNAIAYSGDITFYGGAGVRSNFGGDIQMLTPGGQQVFGVEGVAPPSTAGVLTQGSGNIQLYSQGSILLGQSRVMTTFGGNILAWSDAGDINAGRGSKSTIVYTPPKRVYDQWGNVILSSNVPSTGAGIATLAPIAEVPAGDMDLLAPKGTIDAGEAGIRVSGNVNIFALQVVNAANIKVTGDAKGIPTIAAVNVGALTNASAAASSAAAAAQDVMQRDRNAARQNLPSIFTVRVLGFGNEDDSDVPAKRNDGAKGASAAYDPASLVQVVGIGKSFSAQQLERLTEDERRRLLQDK